MGRRRDKSKPRVIPEQDKKICGTICICQMTMVLSCVSFVYLGVAIYFPSHKAFNIGMDPTPVMCQTVNSSLSKNCSWASCGEWCLTKTTGFCPQIYVNVRRNGTNMELENCTRMASIACPPANEAILKKFNCNNPLECANLTGIFKCRLGHCANLSEMYYCRHQTDKGLIINSDTDNLKLNGLFDCNKAKCSQIKSKFKCDRYCNKITTATVNVYLKYGDSLFTAECERAVAYNEAQGNNPYKLIEPVEIWTEEKSGGALLGSCTDIFKIENNNFKAMDCLNGTVVKDTIIPPTFMNFSQFWAIYNNSTEELHKSGKFLPIQHHVTIYNKSRLYINLEGCVNTLRGECKEFTKSHGKNGSENTAQSRFPCFYNKNDTFFALARFDLNKTWLELMIAVWVPGTLFIISFVTLMVITQTVRVGDDARMRCKWCNEANDTDLRYEAIGKVEDDKDIAASQTNEDEKNDFAMQHLKLNSKEESKINLLETENMNYTNA